MERDKAENRTVALQRILQILSAKHWKQRSSMVKYTCQQLRLYKVIDWPNQQYIGGKSSWILQKEVIGQEVKAYTDKGYSGKNTDRPAFKELMWDIQAGKVRLVIIYRLDQIIRLVLDFAVVIDIFQKHNVDFVSTMEKFDTGTTIGKPKQITAIISATTNTTSGTVGSARWTPT